MTPLSSSAPLVGKSPLAGVDEIVRKPHAVANGAQFMPFAPASPAEPLRIAAGIAEVVRLGFRVADRALFASDGYFAGVVGNRRHDFITALERMTYTRWWAFAAVTVPTTFWMACKFPLRRILKLFWDSAI